MLEVICLAQCFVRILRLPANFTFYFNQRLTAFSECVVPLVSAHYHCEIRVSLHVEMVHPTLRRLRIMSLSSTSMKLSSTAWIFLAGKLLTILGPITTNWWGSPSIHNIFMRICSGALHDCWAHRIVHAPAYPQRLVTFS